MSEATRTTRRRTCAAVPFITILAVLLTPGSGMAQTPGQEPLDSLRAEIEALQVQIDSLRALIQRTGSVQAAEEEEDALARLRAAAREAAAGGAARDTAEAQEQEPEFVGRQRTLQALNPEISVNADVFGRLDPDDPDSENFIPREFEASLQSALDPFSRAKIFVAFEQEGGGIAPFGEVAGHGHEGEEGELIVAVEEGYMEWVNLPGGFGAKVGRFFQQFGELNRWHDHALPFQTRSLPHLAFVGEEALSQTGLSLHWLVPAEGFGTWELTGEVTRSSNGALFGESSEASWLGHVNAFFQLTPATHLDLKASGLFGRHEEAGVRFDQRLWGAEFALNWLPPGRSLYREFLVRGGLMFLDPDAEALPSPEFDDSALGLWSLAEFRFARQWLVGARFDWVENPADNQDTAWLVSPTLSWWQSEWVRLRAEYDVWEGPDGETLDQLMLQVTFAMGPHKHETY